MKRILFIILVGIFFGFVDGFFRIKTGELSAILLRGFLSTLLLSGGLIIGLVRKGRTIKELALESNKIAIPFFIAYLIGVILFKLYN